jgi:hypothetical protein
MYLAQRREDKKKVLARPIIVKSYFGDDADVIVIPAVILIPVTQFGVTPVCAYSKIFI